MKVIDCKKIRTEMITEVKNEVHNILNKTGRTLKLVVIQVDGDHASDVYIKNKIKTGEECGIQVEHIKLSSDSSVNSVKSVIREVNNDYDTTGIILQLPLPDSLKSYEQNLIDEIDWKRDCDGLTTMNVGKLWTNQDCVSPATAKAIMRLMPADMSETTVSIINRSNLIGKPLIKLLLDRNASPSIYHSKSSTGVIYDNVIWTDAIVTGAGVPNLLQDIDNNLFHDSVIIDAAICRNENGKLCGDVDTESIKDTDCVVTSVPGGVGILCVAQLMLNVIKCYKLQHGEIK